MSAVLGTVESVLRFPVKSMRGERLAAADVGPAGVDGDREWALLDDEGHWASAKADRARWRLVDGMLDLRATTDHRVPAGPVLVTLPDGRSARPGTPEADEVLSAHLGRALRFDRGDGGRRWGRHHDASPLHLVTTASLAALAARAGAAGAQVEARTGPETAALDPLRLRPNLVVRTPKGVDGFAEDGWTGTTLRIGDATLQVTAPTERCVMTTRAQGDEVPPDDTVLRRIGTRNRAVAGIYLEVLEAGRVAVGDDVVLVAAAREDRTS